MGQQSVDIVIRARDEASRVFNLAETALTNMQRKIAGQYQQTPSGFSGQIQKQFEARAQLENNLFNLTHTAKEVELNDAKNHFDSLRNEWKDNQSMLTMIQEAETAKRLRIDQQYAESSFVTFKRWRAQYIGVIRSMAIGGLAIRGLEGITGGAIKWRDEGFGAGIRVFAESIPLIGRSIVSLADNITELAYSVSKLNKEEEELGKPKWDLDAVNERAKRLQNELEFQKAPAGGRDRVIIEQARQKELDDIDELINKMPMLTHQFEKQKETVNEIYDLKIIDMETEATEKLTKKKIELSFAEKTLQELKERVSKKRFGEDELTRREFMSDKNVTAEQYLKLLRWQQEEKQIDKNTKAMDAYRQVIEQLNREESIGKKDRFEQMLYDLMKAGVTTAGIAALLPQIERLRTLEKEPISPGWAPFESKHMVGWQAPSLQINYEARTANNTQKMIDVFLQAHATLKQILHKTQVIPGADL